MKWWKNQKNVVVEKRKEIINNMDLNKIKELEKVEFEYQNALLNYKRFENELDEMNELKREEVRKKQFDLYFKKLQPLVDTGITLKYDEKYEGYYFPDEGVYLRSDGKLYNKGLYVEDYVVEELIENILNPKSCRFENKTLNELIMSSDLNDRGRISIEEKYNVKIQVSEEDKEEDVKEAVNDYVSFLKMIGKEGAINHIQDTFNDLKARLMIESFINSGGTDAKMLELHKKYYNPKYLHIIKPWIKDSK